MSEKEFIPEPEPEPESQSEKPFSPQNNPEVQKLMVAETVLEIKQRINAKEAGYITTEAFKSAYQSLVAGQQQLVEDKQRFTEELEVQKTELAQRQEELNHKETQVDEKWTEADETLKKVDNAKTRLDMFLANLTKKQKKELQEIIKKTTEAKGEIKYHELSAEPTNLESEEHEE